MYQTPDPEYFRTFVLKKTNSITLFMLNVEKHTVESYIKITIAPYEKKNLNEFITEK